jgi:alanine racemase
MRPTWVEISRSALLNNLTAVRSALQPGTEVCAIVKANAYGHGAAECATVFQRAGVKWFAVTSVEGGAGLRRAKINGRILVLGGFTRDDAELLVNQQLTPAIWDKTQIEWLASTLRDAKAPLPVHVKLDSGMARLGVTADQEGAFFDVLSRRRELTVEALFTHFSSAEDEDSDFTEQQMERFSAARERLSSSAGNMWHVANSAAALRFPDLGGSFVRAGLALYGYVLNPNVTAACQPALRAALAWKTRIIALRTLTADQPVGYNGSFVTHRKTRVATLAVGYADGYRRDLSTPDRHACVIVRGACSPVIGNISMDLTTIDVTDVTGVEVGDEVVLIGSAPSGASMTAATLADVAGTITYEILCGISDRVERRYVE